MMGLGWFVSEKEKNTCLRVTKGRKSSFLFPILQNFNRSWLDLCLSHILPFKKVYRHGLLLSSAVQNEKT